MHVLFALVTMRVRLVRRQLNEIQLSVTNTAFRDHGVRESAHLLGQAFQDHGFKAVFVVQMAVGGRNAQIVVIMLLSQQAFRQCALVMVVDIGQIGHTVARSLAALTVSFQCPADEITHSFGAVNVAALGNQAVKFGGQFIV